MFQLEQYDLYYFISVVLVIEIIVLVLVLLTIIWKRISLLYINKRIARDSQFISNIIDNCLKHNTSINTGVTYLEKYSAQRLLLECLERYNRRFNDEEWGRLKRAIVQHYLLPRARQYATSRFWTRRNFAARCFALTPLPEDEEQIMVLVDDPVFLVRQAAAVAIVRLESKQGVFRVLQHMSRESGYAHYFYRDLLLTHETLPILQWIKEWEESEANVAVHLTCLDLLAYKSIPIAADHLKKDLNSANTEVRFAALRVYARNPQNDSLDTLLRFIDNPDEKIRIETVFGLQHFASPAIFERLQNALKDKSWAVRSQAAESLKVMGPLGLEILHKQDPTSHYPAYEAAQYALHFA